jgi:hypothetical protein
MGGLNVGNGGSAGTSDNPDEACRSIPIRPEAITVEVEVPVTVEIPVEVPYEVEVEVPYEVVEEHPTAIYVMLDRSGSMDSKIGGSNQSLWQSAVASLTTFVNDSGSAGLQVALQYFPMDGVDYGVPFLPSAACTNAIGSPHNTPAVAMNLLPGNAGNIASSLNGQSLGGVGVLLDVAAIGVAGAEHRKQAQAGGADIRLASNQPSPRSRLLTCKPMTR